MPTLDFTRLRALVEEGAGSSLTERRMFRKQAPEKAASKRKGAPTTDGQWTARTQGRTGVGGGGGSTFMAPMLERGIPPSVCDFAWCGDVCRRVNCSFSHLLPSGTAPSIAVHQQQLHARPPPPLPPPTPPPPTQRQQPPQYQAAATVGGGVAGGGAGASRPPSVARFSKTYALGGRGGSSAEGGAGRGTGRN